MSDLRRRVPQAHLQRHHRYDFHMFVHVRRGKCRAVVDFRHIECGAGSLLTIRPGQVHRFGPGSRWDANLLLFRPELLQASQGEERLQMPELIDALPGHLRLDRSTGRFLADTLARLEEECVLEARQPLLNWLLQSELATLVMRLHIFHTEQQPPAGASADAPERFRLSNGFGREGASVASRFALCTCHGMFREDSYSHLQCGGWRRCEGLYCLAPCVGSQAPARTYGDADFRHRAAAWLR